MTPGPDRARLEAQLAVFGLTEFRPGQREVIEAVLAGSDCLCVMPTGGGKSLCYQLPGLTLNGLTLVVSPLIALMKDQVDQLLARRLPVTFINSTLTTAEQYERLDRMAAGQYRLVYVVPERFRSARFLEAVRKAGIKLLAIDEAHCISQWGHDFRPDYARLGHFRRLLGNPTTIALTATATDAVRRDIVEQLQLRDPRTFITGFARPNLHYEVQFPRTERQKAEMLIRFLRSAKGAGIVYASTRKKTEEVAALIAQEVGRASAAYHAGLAPDQRRAAQEAFMGGEVEIITATTAFGMGIDKPDVRFVVHYNLPGTLEGYYQEAGRAGRDGKPSHCLLLYAPSDRFIQEFFIESAYPGREHVAAVYEFLRRSDESPIQLTQQEIKERLGLPVGAEGIGTCEQLLESAGVLERLMASENLASVRIDSDLPTLVDLLPRQAKVRRQVVRAVERIVGDRRQEMVYFRPRDLLQACQLDQAAVTAALRELNALEVFTYVPPFRGRAIRMLRRDARFDELQIDFEAHERLKAVEYDKLNRVIRFALSRSCRQQEILRYFGDPRESPCAHCDNCRRDGRQGASPAVPPEANDNVLTAVRIALSGIARTSQSHRRCGKNLIAQMLCGSDSAKVKKLGLDRLSTFGLLAHLGQSDVAALIDALVAAGLAQQVEIGPRRPVVELTSQGSEVMKGAGTPEFDLPVPADLMWKLRRDRPGEAVGNSASLATAADADLPMADPELVAALDRWRREQCSDSGLPPHYVLPNAAIKAIARQLPRSLDELAAVKGIGPSKLKRYGDELLRIVNGGSKASKDASVLPACQSGPSAPIAPAASEDGRGDSQPSLAPMGPPAPVSVAASRPPGRQPPHYWTWRLLNSGFSAEECMAARQIDRESLLDHLLRAVEEGLPVKAEWCLGPTLLAALEKVVCDGEPERIRPLLPELPGGTRYEEVQLFLKCRRASPVRPELSPRPNPSAERPEIRTVPKDR